MQVLRPLIPQFFDNRSEPYRTVNQYIRIRSGWWSENTVETNAQHFSEFLNWIECNGLEIGEITARELEHYANALCIYRRKNGKPLAWSTINGRILAIRMYLKWAYDNHLALEYNEPAIAQIGKQTSHKRNLIRHPAQKLAQTTKFLFLDDAVSFINSFKQLTPSKYAHLVPRNQLMASLMLEVGLRVSEVVSFPIADLPEINTRGSATAARVIGKGKKARAVLIPNRLLAYLWEYVEIDREKITENLIKEKRDSATTLFLKTTGTALSRNWVEKMFQRYSEGRTFKVHPHILRHTFGTYHYLRNGDLATLMKLMGHSSEETTREFYIHTANLVAQSANYKGLQESIDRMTEIEFA